MEAEQDAWAFGAGFAVGFTGSGEVIQASAFALGFESETDKGLIVVLELMLLGNKKPIAIGVFEYDFRLNAFILQLIIDIKLQDLIENFPEEIKVRLGGTVTIGNRPGLVAIGRLDQPQETWLGANIEIALDSPGQRPQDPHRGLFRVAQSGIRGRRFRVLDPASRAGSAR